MLAIPPSSAYGMTGAELLQSDRTLAIGYVHGVTHYRTTVMFAEDAKFTDIRDCIVSSRASARTIYEITVTRLKTHPSELPLPALFAVVNALAEMCVP